MVRPPKKIAHPGKRIFDRIDEKFHDLFFNKKRDFNHTNLELIVTDSFSGEVHAVTTQGRYVTDGKHTSHWDIEEEISYRNPRSLATDYLAWILDGLDRRLYRETSENDKTVISFRASKDGIIRKIDEYIQRKRGYLSQDEFMELTGASEQQLVSLFGEHESIAERHYSRDDVLRYSRRFYKRFISKWVGRRLFRENEYQDSANIINIYRKILNEEKPKQMMLFSVARTSM